MLFIIFFAAFIFVLTVWENIFLTCFIFGLLLVGLIVFIIVKNRTKSSKIAKHRKVFLSLSIAFLLATGCRIWNNNSLVPTASTGGGSFMGTGMIQDTYTQGKYIFTDGKDVYVLYTKKEYQIGQGIFLVGRKMSGATSGSAGEQGFLAFDYAKWLKMKGWEGTIYETNSSLLPPSPSKIEGVSRSREIKKTLQQKIISAYGKDRIAGLVLGMLIGDRSQIPKDDYQTFINSGLVHIIAVSGGNIVMITVFLGFILFFIPFYIRTFIILITIILYGLICGLDSSVFRAVITGGLSLIALFRGREVPVRRLMSIAFVGMLMVNPYYLVYDIGFLMSFAAVIGIVLISQKKDEKGKEKKNPPSAVADTPFQKGGTKALLYIWKNYLQPSVGATLGVFPIIIFFMGKINMLSIVSNLFILPILPFVMIYGFISVYLYQFLGRSRLLRIERTLISYIYKVSEISSAFGLYLSMNGWVKRSILVGFLIGFVWWRNSSSTPGSKSS